MTTQDGYVTDVPYVAEFYGDHSPTTMNLVAAFTGYRPRPLDEPFTWCDFGCGNGVTTNVLAACYPHAQFYGIDFMPVHIRNAETLAMRGGLDNTTFLEKSFTDLADDDLPPLDFAVMHGVLSWVPDDARTALLDEAAKRIKPGGMVMTGYNAMPGWAAKLPLRDMIFSLTADTQDSIQKAKNALAWLKRLKEAEVKYFRDHPALSEMVDELSRLDLAYMAHEYFNENLKAFHFAQMNSEMNRRGFQFAGSATIFLNMLELAVPPDFYDEFRGAKSRPEFEAKRDFIRNETFRRDVWVKGETVETIEELDAIQEQLILGTTVPDSEIDQTVAFGHVELDYTETPFNEALEAYKSGARPMTALGDLPVLDLVPPPTRIEASRLLVAGGQVVPFAHPSVPVDGVKAKKFDMPDALNRASIEHLAMSNPRIALASQIAGTGIELTNLDALVLLGLCKKGREGAVAWAVKKINPDKGEVMHAGKALGANQIKALLKTRLDDVVSNWLPKLLELGIITPAK